MSGKSLYITGVSGGSGGHGGQGHHSQAGGGATEGAKTERNLFWFLFPFYKMCERGK